MVVTTTQYPRRDGSMSHFVEVSNGNISMSFLHDGSKTLETGKQPTAELTNGRKYARVGETWKALPHWGDGKTAQDDVSAIEALFISAMAIPIHYLGECKTYLVF